VIGKISTLLLLLSFLTCGRFVGIYHTVEPGQTLYRIALTYKVDLEELKRINRIEDPRTIQPGDKIFIPGARHALKVPPTVGGYTQEEEKTVSSLPQERKVKEKGRERKPPGNLPPPPSLILPTSGTLTQTFSSKEESLHEGIDISAPEGRDVLASASGRVLYADNRLRGYGNMVIIRHEGKWATIYAHLKRITTKEGEFVSQGEKIGEVGSTGRSTAPHLHFELRYGKTPVDPLLYLPSLTGKP